MKPGRELAGNSLWNFRSDPRTKHGACEMNFFAFTLNPVYLSKSCFWRKLIYAKEESPPR